jgi:hypothetical protein
MRRLPLLVMTLALTLPAALVDADDWSGDQDLAKRLKQLEEETQSLRVRWTTSVNTRSACPPPIRPTRSL